MRTVFKKQNQPQAPRSSGLARSSTATPGLNQRAALIPYLQRTIGSQVVQRMPPDAEELEAGSAGAAPLRLECDFAGIPIHSPAPAGVQTKLAVSRPSDRYEQEADHVAKKVMRMPAPAVQQTCATCTQAGATCSACKTKEQEEGVVQRKRTGLAPAVSHAVPDNLLHSLGPGQPLAPATRSFFEPRFGHDFSNIRIHADGRAAASARSIHAKAYTAGRSIVFGAGEFRPEAHEGRLLLAHEITHIIQQEHGSSKLGRQIQRTIGDGHDLQATRFVSPGRNTLLEATFDIGDRTFIQKPDKGAHVKLLQESLLAMGYALPGFGADGDFGDETEAAIIQFQSDAGAREVDGIVGPETMELFDQHDPTRPGGIGPPARTGPVPSPLPPPAQDCDVPFKGVTFTLTKQVASGVSPAAKFYFILGQTAMNVDGNRPVRYEPRVEISAPSEDKAREFEVGFVSNCLTSTHEYTYSNRAHVRYPVPTPIKDGERLSTGDYDPVFTCKRRLQSFVRSGDMNFLDFPDTPQGSAMVYSRDNPECAGFPDGMLTDVKRQDYFRTWVAVRHKASGCTRGIHHIDWNTDWRATVGMTGAGLHVSPVSDAIKVTTADGDGKPPFIQGGQVLNDFLAKAQVCE